MLNHSYRSLRRVIGILGIALPILLIIGNMGIVEKSISYYYYTKMSTVFTGVLITFGLVLITYKGTPESEARISENLLTTIGGFCALLVALVPTRSGGDIIGFVYFHDELLRGFVHYLSAAVFILFMGLVVLLKFAQAPYFRGLYRILGVIILVGLGFTIYVFLHKYYTGNVIFTGDIFWGETLSLWAFGIAWLRRGVPKKS